MKRKIIILLMSLFVLSSCDSTIDFLNNDKVSQFDIEKKYRVQDLTVDQSVEAIIRNLYGVQELDYNVVKNVNMMFQGFQDGSLLARKTINEQGQIVEINPEDMKELAIGKIEYSTAASFLFQLLYQKVNEIKLLKNNSKNNSDDSLKLLTEILDYENLRDDTKFHYLIIKLNNEILSVKENSLKEYCNNNKKNNKQSVYCTMQDFSVLYKTFVHTNQKEFNEISNYYETLLLDTTSSASKSAGGAGNINISKYTVSQNIYYTFASLFIMMNQKYIVNPNSFPINITIPIENPLTDISNLSMEKLKIVANTVYNLSGETKIKLTYNTQPAYFKVSNALYPLKEIEVMEENLNNLVKDSMTSKSISPEVKQKITSLTDRKNKIGVFLYDLLYDIVKTKYNIVGGTPYPNTFYPMILPSETFVQTDDEIPSSTLKKFKNADELIIETLGEKIIGSPAGNDIFLGTDNKPLRPTTKVLNRLAYFYDLLKENGLKAPKQTSKIGASTLSSVISNFLINNQISYLLLNKDRDISHSSFSKKINEMFYGLGGSKTSVTTDELSLKVRKDLCDTIILYNTTLDNSAIYRDSNKGFFAENATGSLCNITINRTPVDQNSSK